MRRPLIAGNWKMHGSRAENAELIEALRLGLPDQIPFDIVVCPPFVYLWEVARLLKAAMQRLRLSAPPGDPSIVGLKVR